MSWTFFVSPLLLLGRLLLSFSLSLLTSFVYFVKESDANVYKFKLVEQLDLAWIDREWLPRTFQIRKSQEKSIRKSYRERERETNETCGEFGIVVLTCKILRRQLIRTETAENVAIEIIERNNNNNCPPKTGRIPASETKFHAFEKSLTRHIR